MELSVRRGQALILCLCVTVSSCGGGGSGASSPPPTAPISGFNYTFDDNGATIVDHSGNNYAGIPVSLSTVPGKVNSAVQFLVSGSKIDLPLLQYFPFNNGFTFMAWVKTDHAIVAREQLLGGFTGGDPAVFYPISNLGISLVNGRISFEVPAKPNFVSVTSDPVPIVNNQWFHIAITYDRNTVKFFFNGANVGTASILTTFGSVFQNQIGHNFFVFGGITIVDQFLGALDELRMENTVRSDSDILAYYNLTK